MSRSGHYIRQKTGYKAFIPTSLPPHPAIKLEGHLQALHDKARLAIAELNGVAHALANADLFVAMYVRKEALLSSQIEGTQASLENVFEFEQKYKLPNVNDVEEVVNYIKAMNLGLRRLKTLPMSLKLIKELHAVLLKGVRGSERTPGEFKRSQNWIGAAGASLNEASFVPPPPDEAKKAMGDLELYMHNKSTLPQLVDAALIHYQFETIHPFLDGNGRLGRLLIAFYLSWKGILDKPLLYVSYYFKKNRQEYYDRLSLVRSKGDYEQWITFFLEGVIETAQSALATIKKILKLQEEHKQVLFKNKISSPLAVILLEHLSRKPVISINDVQKELDVSFQSASNVINQLEKIKIIKEVTGKRRDMRFVYVDYLKILSEGTKPF